MSTDVKLRDPLRDAVLTESRKVSAVSWGFLALGVVWVCYGMFVLSYRAGSLAAVAALAGTAFVFGGMSQLAVAGRVQHWRWLFVLSGLAGLAAGVVAFVWPGVTLFVMSVLVAWHLVVFGLIHLVGALAGPKPDWWWTQLLLGIGEVGLGIWAVRSWEHSLVTLLTLVGAWAISFGVAEVFAAFSLHRSAERTRRLVD
jgi:uncharacterized membrane protein HdeD (DUF308 family)